MLVRLEMDVEECIGVYTKLVRYIFRHAENWFSVSFRGNVQPRFSSKRLKKAIIEILESKGIPVDEMLDNGKNRSCRTYVV